MLQKQTVSAATLELLKSLMEDQRLDDFFLVGDTALSLQIGHRISIHLDLFSQNPFYQNQMLDYLRSEKAFSVDFMDKNTLKGDIQKVKIDLISHSYPLINQLVIMENIRMASLEDLSAMKLNAIAGNGTCLKDFIDIAFLSCYLSLAQMIDAYERKYSLRNPVMLIKALLYHDDINFNEPIKMVNTRYFWKWIKKRLREMEKQLLLIFKELPVAP